MCFNIEGGGDRCEHPAVTALPHTINTQITLWWVPSQAGFQLASYVLTLAKCWGLVSFLLLFSVSTWKLAYQTECGAWLETAFAAINYTHVVFTQNHGSKCISQKVSLGTHLADKSWVVCRRQRLFVGEPLGGWRLCVWFSDLDGCSLCTTFGPLCGEPSTVNSTLPVSLSKEGLVLFMSGFIYRYL